MTILALTNYMKETLNYWKQLTHVMKYFRQEEDPKASFPKNFISGFLEVCSPLAGSLVRYANSSKGRN